MKPYFLMLIALLFFSTSCKEKTDLDKLKKEKTEILKEIKKKKAKLAEIQSKIDVLDTSVVEIHYPKVSVIESESKDFEHYFEVQGAVDADRDIMVTPEMGGKIVTLPVRKGQFLRKGDIVATFDTEVINSNRQQLEEQLATAKYMYEKQQRLFEKGVGTEIALKQAEGRYKALQKSIEVLNTQKSKSILRAPFSGYVEQVFPVQGGMAGPSTPIIQLIGLSNLKVVANVSENYLSDLDKSTLLNVHFPAVNKSIKNLHISRIGKSVNPVNRTILVEVNIPKPPKNIVPNLMAIMNIRDYVHKDAVLLPPHVILTNANKEHFVFVVNADQTVSEKIITTGKTFNNRTEILSGLEAGEKVVDRGARKIVHGDKVEIAK